jgi:voltage-gated potassium channel
MKKEERIEAHATPWRAKLHEIIFEAETPAGKTFDIILLWAILGSVFAVLMESVASLRLQYGPLLRNLEWGFTILFTAEYVIRCICVKKTRHYTRSFFGVIDLLSIIPTYLSLGMVGAQSLVVIRALRLLRVFRVLKLGRYIGEYEALLKAIKASKDKIAVFLVIIITLTVIMGTVMYLVEGEGNGFTSIPKSIYWAIVTMTTVGYGDIAPNTVLGQFLASIIMILGYAMIVVPTGIFSVELSRAADRQVDKKHCPRCQAKGHLSGAIFCCYCGEKL